MSPKTSESKRRANNKWDKKNMATLGCKLRKEEAAAFKEYAAKQGRTANSLLMEYVVSCISAERNASAEEIPQD
jgi:hypothetical protein